MVSRALLAAVVLFGCTSAELAKPVYYAHRGPAAQQTVRRVVALPATCGSLSMTAEYVGGTPTVLSQRCLPSFLPPTDQLIRSQLDFLGFQVIDSEKVNAVTASRREIITRHGLAESTRVEKHGSLFADATPIEQAAILRELNADAVLNTRILIGSDTGVGKRRSVVVQVRLRAADDGRLIWVHRCEVEIGGIEMDVDGIQAATRCAMGRES